MAVEIVMPKLGMVMSEGMVNRWTKSAGESVVSGEVIAEIETEKVNYDLEATGAGVFHPAVEEGAVVEVGGLLGYLLAPGEGVPEKRERPAPKAPARRAPPPRRPRAGAAKPGGSPDDGPVVPSTPGARKAAIELEVDISAVTPSGPRGRVTESDVRAHAAATTSAKASDGAERLASMPAPVESTPLRGPRRAIAEHMRSSLTETAQLSFFLDVDLTEAQQLRREASAGRDGTIVLADVMMKASAHALSRAPALNAMLIDGVIHRFDTVNIGLAVALDNGLVVPVLRDLGVKSIYQLSAEARAAIEKARAKQLAPDDLAGGTFTISVLGVVDGFTPILNAGQTAILGVGRSAAKPVVRGGEVVVREMCTVSLTVDHQVVDGAAAATFMRRFVAGIGAAGATVRGMTCVRLSRS